ncbi:MAG: hypothetical protein ACLQOZ_07390 [Acidimicrobiales bacterium]
MIETGTSARPPRPRHGDLRVIENDESLVVAFDSFCSECRRWVLGPLELHVRRAHNHSYAQ